VEAHGRGVPHEQWWVVWLTVVIVCSFLLSLLVMSTAQLSTTCYTGLTYTIIHTGGLTDHTPPLHNELAIGHGDDHLEDAHGKPLNRADLALVVEQALLNPESYDKNFDLYSVPHRGKSSPIDFAEFFSRA
jgi:hypothetical protein